MAPKDHVLNKACKRWGLVGGMPLKEVMGFQSLSFCFLGQDVNTAPACAPDLPGQTTGPRSLGRALSFLNLFALKVSCLCLVFCYSDAKLTNTGALTHRFILYTAKQGPGGGQNAP